MTEASLRLECLKQATILCTALKGERPAPQSGDVVRIAQSYFEWITKPAGSARDVAGEDGAS